MSLFTVLKILHILSAIVALGTNTTYRVLLASAARQPEALIFTLKTIRTLDRRLANPGYGLLLVTGLSMVYILQMPLTTPWILSALVLYILIAVLGSTVYAPVFRLQIRLAESEGAQGETYRATARKGNLIGLGVLLLTVLIVILMVARPLLWRG